MDEQTDAAAAAAHPLRDETARQLVILAAGLAFVTLATVVERWLSQPDAMRTARMTAARAGEKVAAAAASDCWHVAEWCRLAYEKAR